MTVLLITGLPACASPVVDMSSVELPEPVCLDCESFDPAPLADAPQAGELVATDPELGEPPFLPPEDPGAPFEPDGAPEAPDESLGDPVRAPGPGAVCAAIDAPLMAGPRDEAGLVNVMQIDGDLIVVMQAIGGFGIDAIQLFASADGALPGRAPGRYPYRHELAESADSIELTVPLSDLYAVCGDTLAVAVHAEIVDDAGRRVSAWATGMDIAEHGPGSVLRGTICCAD